MNCLSICSFNALDYILSHKYYHVWFLFVGNYMVPLSSPRLCEHLLAHFVSATPVQVIYRWIYNSCSSAGHLILAPAAPTQTASGPAAPASASSLAASRTPHSSLLGTALPPIVSLPGTYPSQPCNYLWGTGETEAYKTLWLCKPRGNHPTEGKTVNAQAKSQMRLEMQTVMCPMKEENGTLSGRHWGGKADFNLG